MILTMSQYDHILEPCCTMFCENRAKENGCWDLSWEEIEECIGYIDPFRGPRYITKSLEEVKKAFLTIIMHQKQEQPETRLNLLLQEKVDT